MAKLTVVEKKPGIEIPPPKWRTEKQMSGYHGVIRGAMNAPSQGSDVTLDYATCAAMLQIIAQAIQAERLRGETRRMRREAKRTALAAATPDMPDMPLATDMPLANIAGTDIALINYPTVIAAQKAAMAETGRGGPYHVQFCQADQGETMVVVDHAGLIVARSQVAPADEQRAWMMRIAKALNAQEGLG